MVMYMRLKMPRVPSFPLGSVGCLPALQEEVVCLVLLESFLVSVC